MWPAWTDSTRRSPAWPASASAPSAASRRAFPLAPGLEGAGWDGFAPETPRLAGEARAAVGVGDSTGLRRVAVRPAVATLYDSLTKCADSVVPPQFVLFPYQMVLDGVVLPARRAHVFVPLQAGGGQDGLGAPEAVRLLCSTGEG